MVKAGARVGLYTVQVVVACRGFMIEKLIPKFGSLLSHGIHDFLLQIGGEERKVTSEFLKVLLKRNILINVLHVFANNKLNTGKRL